MAAIDAIDIAAPIVVLVATWLIVSVPVYVSAKLVTMGRVGFLRAMGATALGSIAYAGVFFATTLTLGPLAAILASLLAFAAWVWIFKRSFRTGWLSAIGISILAILIFIGAAVVIGVLMIFTVPGIVMHPLPTPVPMHPV